MDYDVRYVGVRCRRCYVDAQLSLRNAVVLVFGDDSGVTEEQ